MTAAQASSSLMVLAVATLVIPAAYHASKLDGTLPGPDGILGDLENMGKNSDLSGLLKLSRGTAIVRRPSSSRFLEPY
jgi:Ca2+:H+ antiporter